MPGLADFERRRVEACRLHPSLALGDLDDAEAFLHDRGLLTLTPCCSLPSLFGACHEAPHSPGKRGFGQYPKTRWWWGGALAEIPGVTATKLHQGKTLYLSPRLVELVDPLCRNELRRAAAGDLGSQAARMVDHLESAGPSMTEDLKVELDLRANEYQRVRRTLEGCGAVISRSITVETKSGGHSHASLIARWDQVIPAPKRIHEVSEVATALFVAVVVSAILIPEREARHALKWTASQEVVDRCLDEALVSRVSPEMLGVSII